MQNQLDYLEKKLERQESLLMVLTNEVKALKSLVLKDNAKRELNIDDIAGIVLVAISHKFRLKVSEIVLKRRGIDKVVRAKKYFSKIMKDNFANDYRLSLKEIGAYLGGKDHTSVIHQISSLESLIYIEDHTVRDYDDVKQYALLMVNEKQVK